MPTSAQRWRRIERILDGALDLPPERRAEFLSRICARDEELHAEVERLLRSCERARGFLETTAGEFAQPLLSRAPGCGALPRGAS